MLLSQMFQFLVHAVGVKGQVDDGVEAVGYAHDVSFEFGAVHVVDVDALEQFFGFRGFLKQPANQCID